MDELITFAKACLDEDEAAAKEAASRPLGAAWDDGTRLTAVARHINRHDPARVLREVAAKRAIVARYERAAAIPESVLSFRRWEDSGYAEACLDAVRDLATAWNDRPGYRPEWAPEGEVNDSGEHE
jgi:hypothetical protein